MEYLFCSSYDVSPSESDVLNHMTLIRDAAKRDTDLTKSKVHIVLFLFWNCMYVLFA